MAIKDGVPGSEIKAPMIKIVERREELESFLEGKEEAPVLLHPNMSLRYQEEVNALRESLNRKETRSEEADLLRGLIDKIVLTPKACGKEYAIDLHGDLTGILTVSAGKQQRIDECDPLLQQVKMMTESGDQKIGWQDDSCAGESSPGDNPSTKNKTVEVDRAFWRWCATRPEYASIIDIQATESKELRDEVPSRKSKKFDVLQRAHLPAWFAAVRHLNNPVISAYLQGLLLLGCRREELADLYCQDVDFQWNSTWIKDKIYEEGRKIPLTPYFVTLISSLPRRNQWVFSSPTSSNGRIVEPRIPHNRALSIAGLPPLTLHGLRRTFASLAEWAEIPHGIVAQIMGHAPSATAERHYIDRPLELLAVWHGKYEAWILQEAGINFVSTQARLHVVKK